MCPKKRQKQATAYSHPADPTAYLRKTSTSGLVLSGGLAGSAQIRGVFIIKGNTAGFTELYRSPGENVKDFTERAQKILEAEFQSKLERIQREDAEREFLANFVEAHNRGLQPEK
jgi:hypothetical protein